MGLEKTQRPVVLIVEDEFLLRMDAIDMIAAAGFDVLEAANADEAIEILEARRDVAVVFTDIQMPGSMDGLKLANAVRKRWPRIVLILASGRITPQASELPAETAFIPKPYREAQLLAALARVKLGHELIN